MHGPLTFQRFDRDTLLPPVVEFSIPPGGRNGPLSVNHRGFGEVLGKVARGVSFLIADFVIEKTWAFRFGGQGLKPKTRQRQHPGLSAHTSSFQSGDSVNICVALLPSTSDIYKA